MCLSRLAISSIEEIQIRTTMRLYAWPNTKLPALDLCWPVDDSRERRGECLGQRNTHTLPSVRLPPESESRSISPHEFPRYRNRAVQNEKVRNAEPARYSLPDQ